MHCTRILRLGLIKFKNTVLKVYIFYEPRAHFVTQLRISENVMVRLDKNVKR